MAASNDFVEQFIDDYFSESEEHLGVVRRLLMSIEDAQHISPEPSDVSELLRSLHTLKGLAGMVGLAAAEEVAHAMEDGVRSLPRGQGFPPELLESLFVGESLLEACTMARRANAIPPSPGPFVDRMRDVLQRIQATAPTLERLGESGLQPLGTGARVFEFTPSAELARRGVGVEIVRQRLASLGDITATVPLIRPEGGVKFEFSVRLRANAAPDESWHDDGLSWQSSADDDVPLPVGLVHAPQANAPAAWVPPSTSNVVRVDLSRLDELMRMVGELVVARARLGEVVARVADRLPSSVSDDLNDSSEIIERQVRLIREGVMRVRLVAVGEVFERMRFAMRDIARETQKAIRLEFSGQETEIDKLVVDRMLEPLLHLVRNAASHGIEPRADRVAMGKEPEGTIWLRARAAGDRMVIEIQDDGAGIDAARVARRARDLGLGAISELSTSDALLDVICAQGFSTRESADMASGRGIGMAVVRSTIRGLGGELFLDTIVGQGTRFTIELPLTLMITDALLIEVGGQSMAIPQTALREIIALDDGAVTRLENNEVLSYRGRVLPLVNLAARFNLASSPGAVRHVLIVGTDARQTGLVVDRLIGLREIVVHPITDPIIAVPGIGGATELPDGRVSLILDAPALVRDVRDAQASVPRLMSKGHQMEPSWS